MRPICLAGSVVQAEKYVIKRIFLETKIATTQ